MSINIKNEYENILFLLQIIVVSANEIVQIIIMKDSYHLKES